MGVNKYFSVLICSPLNYFYCLWYFPSLLGFYGITLSWIPIINIFLFSLFFSVLFFFFFLCSKCNGFILLWCETKDSTTIQRPIYYKVMKQWCGTCRTRWTTGGAGRLLWTWPYTVAEEHIENNTAELNWNVARTWQLPGMPASTSLRMDSVPKLQCGEEYNSLEE